MRRKTGILLIVTLLLSSSVFSVFASEEVALIDDEKAAAETVLTEETQSKATQEADVSDKKVSKNATVVIRQTKAGSGRAIVQNGTLGTVDWTLDDAGVLTFGGGVFPDNYNWLLFGNIVGNSTKTVIFTAPVKAGNHLNSMFAGYTRLNTINGFEKLDTADVIDMNNMFQGCRSLTSLDVSNFDTSKVTNMNGTFEDCSSLTNLDVSNFDTSKVTDMRKMFFYCNRLTNLDVTNFDTSSVTEMGAMFRECSSLTDLDVRNFDTSSVTGMDTMFGGNISLTNLDVSNFDTSQVRNMNSMFNNCRGLTNLDVTNFDTSQVIYMDAMFAYCTGLTSLDLSNFNTRNVTDMWYMFGQCTSLRDLDLSSFDTSNVRGMAAMFSGCYELTNLNLSNFDMRSVAGMMNMFNASPIKELSIGRGFSFKYNNHTLDSPPTNAEYTGNWERVGAGETFTHAEFLNYNGTKPGTYIWQRAVYNVTYDSNGGSAVTEETVANNSQVTEPANPTKTGYTFAGWYKEANLTNEWDFTTDLMPANNITLYAKWNINSYDVTYDSKGGSAVAGETVVYNSAVTEPANPTKAGYIFEGWHKDQNYADKWEFLIDLVQGHTTLHAKWKAQEYQITYDLDGGTNSSNNPSTYEFAVGVTNFEDPTKDGYKFLGWFESDTSNVEITNIGATEIGDKTLFARWEKIESSAKPGATTGGTGTPAKYNKVGVKTGDPINILGLGVILLVSGGYIITRKTKRKNNG